MPPATGLFCAAPDRLPDAQALAARFALPLLSARPAAGYWLELDEARLSLLNPDKHGPVYAEFVEGAAAHRRQFGGGPATSAPRRGRLTTTRSRAADSAAASRRGLSSSPPITS